MAKITLTAVWGLNVLPNNGSKIGVILGVWGPYLGPPFGGVYGPKSH